MDIFSVLTLIGGLAMFLFGMNVMGTGLEKLSGGRLESILEKLTSSAFKGVLLGMGVTAVIQSSSAVTVMVVGFVNSGIMKLGQAVGVIMGANIGTTITSWLLSLTGIEGDSMLIRLLKPESFSPILAIIGIGFVMVSKNQKKIDIGNIFVGFAVLMYGMSAMSGALKPLADMPEFQSAMVRFTNPFLGLLVGALLTAVIQSSSASIGILQALALTGGITYEMAIPIIMGQNIGTCVTALISSMGTNANAKRASFIHLYFNVCGAALGMAVFAVGKYVLQLAFFSDTIGVVGIAIVHSVLNIAATVILFPFNKLLVKLAVLTVKDDAVKPDKSPLIEDRFLLTPTYAIEKCKELTYEMADMAKENVLRSMELVDKYDEELKLEIDRNEESIDEYEDSLETYLMKVSTLELRAEDSHEMIKLHHAIGNFERIGDYGINLLKTKKGMHKKGVRFSNQALAELEIMRQAVVEILNLAIGAYVNEDVKLARKVEPLEQVIDELKDELRRRHIRRFEKGECTIEQGFAFLDIISSYERISDHCSSIAVAVIEMAHNSYQPHEYLSAVKAGENRFREFYEDYRMKYALNETQVSGIM